MTQKVTAPGLEEMKRRRPLCIERSLPTIKNHAFIDGDKRVGFAALPSMLKAHGFTIPCTEKQAAATLKAAACEFREQWTAWVSAEAVPTAQGGSGELL